MGEVEVVDADDEGGEAFAVLEGLGEGADEGGLADTLEAVEADDEGAGSRGVALAVGGELGEDEGDADGGLVVDDAGLEGGVGGAGCCHFGGVWGMAGVSVAMVPALVSGEGLLSAVEFIPTWLSGTPVPGGCEAKAGEEMSTTARVQGNTGRRLCFVDDNQVWS